MMKRKSPNYLKVVTRAVKDGKLATMPGSVLVLHVYHDDWCDYFKGKDCNCHPRIEQEVTPLTGEKGSKS